MHQAFREGFEKIARRPNMKALDSAAQLAKEIGGGLTAKEKYRLSEHMIRQDQRVMGNVNPYSPAAQRAQRVEHPVQHVIPGSSLPSQKRMEGALVGSPQVSGMSREEAHAAAQNARAAKNQAAPAAAPTAAPAAAPAEGRVMGHLRKNWGYYAGGAGALGTGGAAVGYLSSRKKKAA